jgi:hypothetical protein
MRMTLYTPEQFNALGQFVKRVGLRLNLSHRPFVDHYYASGDWSKLYMNLDKEGSITATYGLESLRFEYHGREMKVGFGSSHYSIEAGAGLYLYVHADDSCPVKLLYGGSPDAHKLVRSLGWAYYSGVRVYVLNKTYEAYPGDQWFRLAAKSVARRIARKRLSLYAPRVSPEIRKRISVQEEQSFDKDLLPPESPFTLRFAPSAEYLNWRYNTRLSFVRYRLFRILESGRTAGYVVINEMPEKLILAQCDGIDPRSLAYGSLLSILEAGREDREPRSVVLTSCHPVMQKIYASFGFQPEPEDRPFCLGATTGPADVAPDTSNWLVNFDWGDNGLRAPFLDQTETENHPGKTADR